MLQEEDRFINSRGSFNPLAAYLDAQTRSLEALEEFPEFFTEDHLERVRQIADICDRFFKVKNGVYVNHRTGHNKPFSVVKVDSPLFPAVSLARKQAEYRGPIEALGGEFRKSAQGVIIHVK